MAQLRFMLQESEGEGGAILGDFLRLKMNGDDRRIGRKSFKERLGLTGMGCCGATWGGFRPTTVDDGEQERQREETQIIDLVETPAAEGTSDLDCLVLIPAGSGMNLAAALAAERQFRSANEVEESISRTDIISAAPGTPVRVSLMRLLEETTDGGEAAVEEMVGSDLLCCVCMGRKKGAAFIPCGHTFCRVCSREVWLNRGTCPICNRRILEILDIF